MAVRVAVPVVLFALLMALPVALVALPFALPLPFGLSAALLAAFLIALSAILPLALLCAILVALLVAVPRPGPVAFLFAALEAIPFVVPFADALAVMSALPVAIPPALLFAEQSVGLTPGSIERYIIAPVILADLIMIPPAEVRVPAPPPVSVPSAASVPFPSAFPLPMPSPMTLPFPSPPSFPLPPMIPPSRLLSPNEAVMYLALNRVSQAMKPVESLHGLLSRIATSLSTTALNGFALNPPTTILPSIFPSSEANAFLTSLVCTAGDCTAIRTAVNAVRMAVTVR